MNREVERREDIEQTAAEWIFRRDSGDWTEADELALNAWLDESTAHLTVFLRLDSAWQNAARLKAVAAGIPPGAIPSPEELRTANFFNLPHPPWASPVVGDRSEAAQEPTPGVARNDFGAGRLRLRALAASALLATIAAAWYLMPRGPEYRTDIGDIEAVPMADGSRVTLNTDSEIRVALTDTERRIDLEQGEAYFEVAKDPTRPFVVAAGDQRIIAIGTKFSVRRDSDKKHVRVIVTEGRVRLEDVSQPNVVPGRGAGDRVLVDAGTVARSGSEGTLVQRKPLTEIENYLSWRTGYLVFHDTPLADAVAEFNRYNEQKIVLEDAHLAGMHIDGNFRATNVNAFIRLLEDGFPVTTEYTRAEILVRTK